MRWRFLLAKALSRLSKNDLDFVSRVARDLQHREEDGWYRDIVAKWSRCRMRQFDEPDPIMEASGCSGEFANDWRRRDVRDGCPWCREEVLENASEPDVMRRWGYR